MKRFLCSILIIVMLPIACFSLLACDEKNDLSTFYSSYKNIANNCPHLAVVEINDTYGINANSYKIDIDYAQSTKLEALVDDSSTKYYHLKHFYQQLLDDTLSPLYFFGEAISNSKKVSDKQTEKLFQHLYELEECYKDIDYHTGTLFTSLKSTNIESVNLSSLKKLFTQYEEAIIVAGNLSALINDIYFNTLLSNTNMDYSSKTYDQLTDTDLNTIAMNVRARMYYYKSVYANVYMQLHVRNAGLAENIIYESAVLPSYIPYNYIVSIDKIETKPIVNLRNSKQDIYKNVISLYNIQNSFDKAYAYFNTASSKISYLDVDVNTSSQHEINYAKIMEQFANGIAVDSYEILENLVELLYL